MSNIKAIAAIAENSVIGNGLTIPWHISEDFKHFKKTTSGSIILMGRKTWLSLGEKPLPLRENVILTSNISSIKESENVKAFSSIESVVDFYKNDSRDIWVIGGAKLYESALDYCSEIIVSHIKMSPVGDVFFPEFKDKFKQTETIMTHSQFDVVKYVKKL